ncbi:MAG: hypothetical protein SFU98_19900 [Leptospiraceae bacterium]|nr:hypothetical protein [Leptospiraceae bacterium]
MKFQTILVLFFLSLGNGFWSEEAPKPQPTAAAAPAKEESPEEATKKRLERRKEKAAVLKDAQILPAEDPLLEVGKINLTRKVAGSARGEFLDVQFNLNNKDFKTKEYQVYVLAVNEGTVPVYYKSKWRPDDPQEGVYVVRHNALSPEPLKEGAVLGDKATKVVQEETQNRILDGRLVKEQLEPNLDDYIAYLIKNSDKALKVKLFGDESPKKEEALISNFKMDDAELNRDVNYATEAHTYTVIATKYQTQISTHHYSLYRPDYKFFNKVVILVFDNSRPRNKLVYRAIQNIGNLKLRS